MEAVKLSKKRYLISDPMCNFRCILSEAGMSGCVEQGYSCSLSLPG